MDLVLIRPSQEFSLEVENSCSYQAIDMGDFVEEADDLCEVSAIMSYGGEFLPDASTSSMHAFEAIVQHEELEHFRAFGTGWDGYGAKPINATVIDNVYSILSSLAPAFTVSPDIVPNPNGTISLEWESDFGYAMLEIGKTRISFYAKPTRGPVTRFDGEMVTFLPSTGIGIGSIVTATVYPLLHSCSAVTQLYDSE